MRNYAISLKRTTWLLAAIAFSSLLLVVNFGFFGIEMVSADQLTTRKLELSSTLVGSTTTGTANVSILNGSRTTQTFSFNVPNVGGGNINSIKISYCTLAIGACTGPTGLNVSPGGTDAALSVQTDDGGAFASAFSIDASGTTANILEIKTGTNNAVTANSAVVLAFTGITNPTSTGTFFARINTYSDAAWTTGVDDGTVAQAITTGIAITTKVVETLGFSTRAVAANGNLGAEVGTSSCDPLSGSGAIALGDSDNTLSIATAYDAYSAFRLYTNSANGVAVQYAGDTLRKSASDTITAVGGTPALSSPGTEQFGLAVDQGANSGGITNADTSWPLNTAGRLELDANYDGGAGSIAGSPVAEFAYDDASPNTPKTIAQSDTAFGGYVSCDSAVVRYLANISPLTAAGTYTTTIVYFAVPTY